MKIDTNKIVAASGMAGFSNYTSATFATTIGGTSIGVGGFLSATASTPLNNDSAISIIEIQYSGLDSFWRLLPGAIIIDYPDGATNTYQVESFSYFSGGNLLVTTYISNQTGGSVAIPAITINCRAFLYVAPF